MTLSSSAASAQRAVVDRRIPLFVTRPATDAAALVDALRARGRVVVPMPVLAIEPVDDATALERTMRAVDAYRLVVFVSPNAIRQALAWRGQPWPVGTIIGVMGPGSVATLQRLGIGSPTVAVISPAAGDGDRPEVRDGRFDSEALFAALDAKVGLSRGFDGRALIVRGNGGRAWFAERLRALGIAVDEVEAYRRVRPAVDAEAAAALDALFAARSDAVFIVTSSEGIDHLVAMVDHALASRADSDAVREWLFGTAVLAPHRRIAERAAEAGFTRVAVCASGDRGVLAAIE